MRARVKLLRRKGVKRPPEELRAAPWLDGLVRIEREPERRLAQHGSVVALLMPLGRSFDPLAQLFNARLVRIERRGFVLLGHEEIWDRKQGCDFPQAWWCVPLVCASVLPED